VNVFFLVELTQIVLDKGILNGLLLNVYLIVKAQSPRNDVKEEIPQSKADYTVNNFPKLHVLCGNTCPSMDA